MSDDALSPREEVLEDLREGRRDILNDAFRVESVGNECIEVHHEAADGGEVVVQLDADVAWLLDSHGDGRMVDFWD